MNILILGGSEFIGRTFVDSLIQAGDSKMFTINRGKQYWNESLKDKKGVNYYYGDRNEYMEFEKLLQYVSKKEKIGEGGKKWDLVVDFSCFERKEVKSVIRALRDKCKLYVFISTDSIYDVCDKKLRRDDFIKEEYGVRPESDKIIEELNKNEDYGNDKLKCEEYLRSHINENDFNYICLRLPDVIGPYDTSGRFWAYMLWIKNAIECPIHVNKYFKLRYLSFVYSEDVCKLLMGIKDIIKQNDDNTKKWLSEINTESFNVCFDNPITLKVFIDMVAKEMGIADLEFIDEKDLISSGKFFYPSVECGPLNNSKAKKLLNFKSIEIETAIKETVKFFKQAEKYMTEFKKARSKYQKAYDINRI